MVADGFAPRTLLQYARRFARKHFTPQARWAKVHESIRRRVVHVHGVSLAPVVAATAGASSGDRRPARDVATPLGGRVDRAAAQRHISGTLAGARTRASLAAGGATVHSAVQLSRALLSPDSSSSDELPWRLAGDEQAELSSVDEDAALVHPHGRSRYQAEEEEEEPVGFDDKAPTFSPAEVDAAFPVVSEILNDEICRAARVGERILSRDHLQDILLQRGWYDFQGHRICASWWLASHIADQVMGCAIEADAIYV